MTPPGHGTWCYVLFDMLMFSQRLDSVILNIFSNHNDALILSQCCGVNQILY